MPGLRGLVAILTVLATGPVGAVGPAAVGTLRLDYFHTGGQGVEIFRKQIRTENRPESVMSALFREEQAQSTRLFAAAEHAGQVGAFRGANYDSNAYYRSQLDCVMFTRNEVPFCGVCQRALDAVIDLYAGPSGTD